MQEYCLGTVHRNGVKGYQAVVYLLVDFWSYESEEFSVDILRWINEESYLSATELVSRLLVDILYL